MQKFLVIALATLLLAGCAAPTPSPTPLPTAVPSLIPGLTLSSPSFDGSQPIPQKFTCQGENVSPALSWSNIPASTKSLALVIEDPDAPGLTFIHWVIYNMPPALPGLPEKVAPGPQVNGVGTQGAGSSGATGYTGPCPPSGSAHHYYFKLYALDLDPALPAGLNAAALQQQINGHVLAQAQWMGTYQRQ